MSHFSVIHWSSLTCGKNEVLNVSGHVAPCEVGVVNMESTGCFKDIIGCDFFPFYPSLQKHPGSLLEGFTQTQVSTLTVKDKLLVAGGFQGELICKVCEIPNDWLEPFYFIYLYAQMEHVLAILNFCLLYVGHDAEFAVFLHL